MQSTVHRALHIFDVEPLRQLGDLRVLREVFRGFSEETWTRGFPSPPLGGFGFVGCDYVYGRAGKMRQLGHVPN